MFKSYFKFAIRNILKNSSASALNIGGLSIGFLCTILIFIYVKKELSFDQWHSKKDSIYRVLTIDEALGVSSNLVGITLPPLGHAMKDELPEVKNAVRVSVGGRNLIEYNKKPIYSENLVYTEQSLFDVFDYKLISGNPNTILQRPNTTVLTETMAKNIFGDENPIGKSITMNSQTDLEVVGVMKDEARDSHMEFDVLVSIIPAEQDTATAQFLAGWNSIAMTTYVELDDAIHEKQVISKMDTIIRRHEVGPNFKVTLQPLADVHLGSNNILFDVYNYNKSDKEYVNTLSIVGLFVILIAAFNFMNLSTAYSVKRAKEVGLRKVMGAFKSQLTSQFLFESIILCFIALAIALLILPVIGIYVDFGIGENLLAHLISQKSSLLFVVLGTLLVGVIAGLYPAFVLSGFGIINILKGQFKTSASGIYLRKGLVIVQFTASVIMIIGTLVVFNQLDYLKNANRGFVSDQIITINLGDQKLQDRGEKLRTELMRFPFITASAFSSSMPGRGTGRTGVQPEGASEDDVWIVSEQWINEDYIPLMGMKMASGRNYSEEYSTDAQQSLIINQAAAKALGWDDPIGKKMSFGQNERTIIGVVEDFTFANMRHKIEPIVLRYSADPISVLSLKLSGENVSNSLAQIEQKWNEVNPEYPFEYSFFDDEYAQQYESDERFASLMVSFTWLAIFIACLGLFGLSTFTAQQRIKEIGIRKVLGANLLSVVFLLSKEFTKPVFISCILACPIAWYFMDGWLQDFAYRIDMPWSTFAFAGLLALLIAQVTVSYQSIRAAVANPIDSLRYE